MEQGIIFKLLKTYKNKYVYDRKSNSIWRISDSEYEELSNVKKGMLGVEESAVIRKYQEEGLLRESDVEEIKHPLTDLLEHYVKNRVKHLTLQVTQQCNLRCHYCAYSGIYSDNRTHSKKRMSFETAQKAIDFLFSHSLEQPDVIIGFYGGEPLLEFELIKKCVAYVRRINEGKKVKFNMTTNGTLLKGEIAEFLVENDFDIAVSLDGSKEEHDVNRQFVNGGGSFDTVIGNLQSLMEKHPKFGKDHILIATTVNPYMNLECVMEYFSTQEIIDDSRIVFNNMVERGLKDEISYDESFFRIRSFEYIKLLFALTGKLEEKYVSQLMIASRAVTENLNKGLKMHTQLHESYHHGGPCLPGIYRLFARTDGALFPCERVNEELPYYKIGTVDEGFDLERMRDILNIGKITEEECKTCWNLQQCMMCSSEIEAKDHMRPSREEKLAVCQRKEAESLFSLHEQCILKEFGYELDKEVM